MSRVTDIDIRPVQSLEEYRAVENFQRAVWGMDDIEIVPDHVLITAHKHGGLVLVAFAPAASSPQADQHQPQLIGYVFGFVGLDKAGNPKHCSHHAGLLPDQRSQGLGFQMKLAQRQFVLNQGLKLITWTYDPLEGRNARLNIHKLGAVCNTFLPNVYGTMRNSLYGALPTDRMQVDWHITSQWVARHIDGSHPFPTLAGLQTAGVPIVNPATAPSTPTPDPAMLRPAESPLPLEGPRLLLEIPQQFKQMRDNDGALALAWRQHTRPLFEQAFAAGYSATDLLLDGNRVYYLLEQHWSLQ